MSKNKVSQLAVCRDQIPLVTVAMPIYNAGKYLRLAVLSVIEQTFPNWELLIIDDGSTDNALADINDINDTRIHIISDGVNKGLGARLNQAIDLARGKFFARMDQDDVSFPERFELQLEKLESDLDLDLVAVRSIAISEENKFLGHLPFDLNKGQICKKPWRGFYLVHPTWMGKIDWFKKHRYSTPAPYLCEDQELLLRTYKVSKFDIIPLELFAYRLRDGIVWKKMLKTRISVMRVQMKYFVATDQFGYLFLAFCVFLGRLVMDVMLKILNKRYFYRSDNCDAIKTRWAFVLKCLSYEK